MKKTKIEVIKCPICGKEYLPVEIYLPQYFFGTPHDILRDDSGLNILSVSGTLMDLKEEYICDNCNKKFKVQARISFNTTTNETINNEVYTTIFDNTNT